MTTTEALEILKSGNGLESEQFAVLQAIAQEVNTDPDSRMSKELVLRAMERRTIFEPTQDILLALVRETGLYPYLDDSRLGVRDLLAMEYHRPEYLTDIVFHQEQSPIYHRLLAGHNVVLSAPTSFGKSKIIDAVLATRKFTNVVIVVPTLALIDETRRRLQSQFAGHYHFVGHPSQEPSDGPNVFIFTPERVVSYAANLPAIDFFVVDEFYKIGGQNEEDRRVVALNEAFYLLYKRHRAQFYMLGPNIRAIAEGASQRFNFEFISTDFQTVACDVIPVHARTEEQRFERLVEICRGLSEQTLIYCKSLAQVNAVAETLLAGEVSGPSAGTGDAADWLASEFHPDWILPRALRLGIAIHYGPLPRSIAHEMVRFFNDGRVRFLVCTSTLIEGVNTKAKNVIIFDNLIARQKLDYFTFNNIKGRSGRMFEHFVGRVFRFHEEPQAELPFVDFPLHTQDANTPESLLIQIDPEDLLRGSRDRIDETLADSPVPLEVLKRNHGIEPGEQIALAEELIRDAVGCSRQLAWTRFPRYVQLDACCDLIWRHWVGRGRNDVFSSRQLTRKIWMLRDTRSTAARILDELVPSDYAARNASEAVERVLKFDRNWASFDFPQYLMALHRIQQAVFSVRNLPVGDYAFFASRVETLFRPEICAALDEYGIPSNVAEKCPFLADAPDLEAAFEALMHQDLTRLRIHPYEVELLRSTRDSLQQEA